MFYISRLHGRPNIYIIEGIVKNNRIPERKYLHLHIHVYTSTCTFLGKHR